MKSCTKYIRKVALLTACIIAVLIIGCRSNTLLPKRDLVPDAETALAIAKSLIKVHYGEKILNLQLPLSAQLVKGTWVVEGTLPPGSVGGVAVVKIDRATGRVYQLRQWK